MLQDDVLVFDGNQQVAIPTQRADFLLQFLHVVDGPLQDGSLVDSAVLTADIAAGTFNATRQQRAEFFDFIVDIETTASFDCNFRWQQN